MRIAPYRGLARLGRTGDPHPDRSRRNDRARPSRRARLPARGADLRRGAALRRAGDRAADRPQAAARASSRCARFLAERRSTSSTRTARPTPGSRRSPCALAVGRPPPLVRTRHISAPVPHDARRAGCTRSATARDRHHRRGATRAADPRHRRRRRRASTRFRPASIRRRFAPGDRDAARRALGLPAGVPLIGIVATLRSWKGHRYPGRGDDPARASRRAARDRRRRAAARRARRADRRAGPATRAYVRRQPGRRRAAGSPRSTCSRCLRTRTKACRRRCCRRCWSALPCVTTDAGAIGEAAIADHTAIVVAEGERGRARRGHRSRCSATRRSRSASLAAGARARRCRASASPRCSIAWKRCFSAPIDGHADALARGHRFAGRAQVVVRALARRVADAGPRAARRASRDGS